MWLSLTRRQVGVTALALAVVVLIYHFAGTPTHWWGEWLWSVDLASGCVLLLSPVVAGAGAYHAAGWQPVAREVLSPGGRRRWIVASTLSVWAIAAGVFLTSVGVVLAVNAAAAPTDRLTLLPVIPSLLHLLLAATVGIVFGLRVPSRVAASVLPLSVYLLQIFPRPAWLPDVLTPAGSTGSLAGLSVNLGALAAAVLVLLGLTTLVGAVAGLTRRAQVAAAGIGVGLVALGSVLAGSVDGREDIYEDVADKTWVCTRAGSPQVCLLPGNSALIDAWQEALRSALAAPYTSGMTYPAVFRQPYPRGSDSTYDDDAGLSLDPLGPNTRGPENWDISHALATPAWCPAYSQDTQASRTLLEQRLSLQGWFRAEMDRSWGGDPMDPLGEWYRATAPADRLATARNVQGALAQCAAPGDPRFPAAGR